MFPRTMAARAGSVVSQTAGDFNTSQAVLYPDVTW